MRDLTDEAINKSSLQSRTELSNVKKDPTSKLEADTNVREGYTSIQTETDDNSSKKEDRHG